MIKLSEGNILAKKKEISNMVKANTSSKKKDLTIRDNGETIKWKEKANLTSNKANSNILVNGKPTNIMDGVLSIQILLPIPNGSHTKASLKMV